MKHSIQSYDKYIGDNEVNKKIYHSILNTSIGTITLLKSKPGSSKTYLAVTTAKECTKESKNKVYLIAIPYKTQVLQASKGYQVGRYIKGDKFDKNERVAFCIYDRVKEVAALYKQEGYGVHIIIDESHLLHGAYDYRQKAIKGIMSLVNDYPVVMITATPRLNLMADALGILKIDQFIEFVSTQAKDKHKTKILDVPSKDRQPIVLEIIEEQAKSHDFTMVRLNNKTMIDLFQDQLQSKGYKVGIAYTGLREGDEDVLNNIIENETIINDYDIVLTTCKLDVGSNINMEHKNICMLHASMTGSDCDLDAIEQFPDRMRNGFETHIILTCSNYEKESREFKDIYNAERKICQAKLEELREHFPYMCMFLKPSQVLEMNALKHTDMNGENLLDYCITLNENDNPVLDDMKILSRANRKYSEMLYRRPDILERVLLDYKIAQEVEFEVYKPKNIVETKEAIKEVVQAHKATKAELDKTLDQYIEVLSGANDLMLGIIFEINEEHLPKEYKEAYGFVEENYPKLLTAIYNCLSVGYTHREIINVLLENAKKPKRGRVAHGSVLKDLRLRMQHLEFNRLYRQGKSMEIIDGSLGVEYRNIMQYMKDKDRPQVTKKLIEELTAYINKSKGKKDKKIDTKVTAKTLASIYFLDDKNRLNLRTRHVHLFK